MPLYLVEAAYTGDSWKSQLPNQANVADRIRPLIEGLGGRLLSLYYAFGEYDVVGLLEMPSNEAAAAFSLAISAGGSVRAFKTTPLMTIEQGQEAMKMAAGESNRYQAPVG